MSSPIWSTTLANVEFPNSVTFTTGGFNVDNAELEAKADVYTPTLDTFINIFGSGSFVLGMNGDFDYFYSPGLLLINGSIQFQTWRFRGSAIILFTIPPAYSIIHTTGQVIIPLMATVPNAPAVRINYFCIATDYVLISFEGTAGVTYTVDGQWTFSIYLPVS